MVAVPAVASGLLMLLYLTMRPYGDAGTELTMEAAAAFASPWWLVAHVAGALALATYALLAVRVAAGSTGRAGPLSRATALTGLVLVLPYYGAETFALHVIGRAAVAGEPGALELVEPIRDQPVAMTMFGVGLALLAVSAVLMARTWQRSERRPGWAAWPLAGLVVLLLPQFFLPPAGRVAYGVAFALAALLLAAAGSENRSTRHTPIGSTRSVAA